MIFGNDETKQAEALEHLYKAITEQFKKGIIVAKYREAILIDSLAQNYIELTDLDVMDIMSVDEVYEQIVLSYELNRPLDLNKLVILGVLSEPILLDSSYLLLKQQVEMTAERNVSFLCKTYKVSATVSIEDIVDEDEILWEIKITLMAGR